MDSILNHAEAVLRQHPAPAMELAELHRRVRERIPVGMPSCAGLRRLMEVHPERFRVLDPWSRPIPQAFDRPDMSATSGVLVVALRPQPEVASAPAPESRLRECVRWLAHGRDVRSLRGAARMYGLLVEGASAHRHLRRKAA